MNESLSALSDEQLLKDLLFLAERERRNLAALLSLLGECAARRLYRDEGHQSLFQFCVRALKNDENDAFRRSTASRVVRQYPDIAGAVAAGELTLTAIVTLAPVVTAENRVELFHEAKEKSRRELESMAAALNPLLSRPDVVKPETPGNTPGWMTPVDGHRVRFGFDAGVDLAKLIGRAKQLLRHKYPEGRLEDVFHDAMEQFLDHRDPDRRFAARRQAPAVGAIPRYLSSWRAGRYIPARVKRAVWQRDGGRCVWRFEDGRSCGSRDGVEYDHIRPFSKGGPSQDERNIRLLCRMHNQLAARDNGLNGEPGGNESRKFVGAETLYGEDNRA